MTAIEMGSVDCQLGTFILRNAGLWVYRRSGLPRWPFCGNRCEFVGESVLREKEVGVLGVL